MAYAIAARQPFCPIGPWALAARPRPQQPAVKPMIGPAQPRPFSAGPLGHRALRLRPMPFSAVGADRSAVTLAILTAAQGRHVELSLERADWLDAIANGELPFEAPDLQPLLHKALRAERLDVVPMPARSPN